MLRHQLFQRLRLIGLSRRSLLVLIEQRQEVVAQVKMCHVRTGSFSACLGDPNQAVVERLPSGATCKRKNTNWRHHHPRYPLRW